MRIDYLVVAFRGDFGLLRLQARSMSRFLDPDSTGRILVVNNDDEPERFARRFEAEIRPDYGALGGRVELVPAAAVLAPGLRCSGYWRQQAIKLRGHALARGPAYVTLDCKNILIRPLGAASFLRADGRLMAPRRRLRDHLTGGMRYFGVAEAAWPDFIIDIYTPVPLWREHCAALDAHVTAREGFGIDALLAEGARQVRPKRLEYLMYGAFLHAHAGGIEAHHDFLRGGLSATYMAVTPDQPAGTVMAAIGDRRWPMMGVHRRAAAAPDAVRRGFAAAWQRFGLVESEEEGLALLAPVAW
jgi:hypothetical protein